MTATPLLALVLGLGSAPRELPQPEDPAAIVKPATGADKRKVADLRRSLEELEAKLRPGSKGALLLARAGGPMRGDPTRLVRVRAAAAPAWPEDLLVAYVILLDGRGRTRGVREEPASQSGDWNIADTWLFDEAGRTVAVRRHRAGFGEGCDGAPAKEDWTAFWDGDRLIARDYTKDPPDRCQLMLAPLEVDATIALYLERRGLVAEAMERGADASPAPAP